MSDKFMAGLVTAAAIAPICAICVLGPAAAFSVIAGAAGWLGGAGPVLTIGLMAAIGLLVRRTLHRRGSRLRGGDAVCDPASRMPATQRDHGS